MSNILVLKESNCANWMRDERLMTAFIKCLENHFNTKLRHNGKVWGFEILDDLALYDEKLEIFENTKWTYDPKRSLRFEYRICKSGNVGLWVHYI